MLKTLCLPGCVEPPKDEPFERALDYQGYDLERNHGTQALPSCVQVAESGGHNLTIIKGF